jgi:hypothetical protein
MDPYLEARWSDVHSKLIAYISEHLQPQLPRDLRARSEERVLLESVPEEELTTYRSDIAVIQSGGAGHTAAAPEGTATLAPVLVDLSNAPQVERFVHIIDVASGNRVITAIEILSPWNKGAGRLNKEYLKKLQDYARAEVNVVEIDLLRSPRGRLEVGQQDLPADRVAPYLTCIRRATRPFRWEIYPMPLRQPLPTIPVPLRQREPDVTLNLQSLMDHVYVAGGHDDVNYRAAPEPPLSAEDAAWADQMLRSAGRR